MKYKVGDVLKHSAAALRVAPSLIDYKFTIIKIEKNFYHYKSNHGYSGHYNFDNDSMYELESRQLIESHLPDWF